MNVHWLDQYSTLSIRCGFDLYPIRFNSILILGIGFAKCQKKEKPRSIIPWVDGKISITLQMISGGWQIYAKHRLLAPKIPLSNFHADDEW